MRCSGGNSALGGEFLLASVGVFSSSRLYNHAQTNSLGGDLDSLGSAINQCPDILQVRLERAFRFRRDFDTDAASSLCATAISLAVSA